MFIICSKHRLWTDEYLNNNINTNILKHHLPLTEPSLVLTVQLHKASVQDTADNHYAHRSVYDLEEDKDKTKIMSCKVLIKAETAQFVHKDQIYFCIWDLFHLDMFALNVVRSGNYRFMQHSIFPQCSSEIYSH